MILPKMYKLFMYTWHSLYMSIGYMYFTARGFAYLSNETHDKAAN